MIDIQIKDKLPTILTKEQIIKQAQDAVHTLDGVPVDVKPVLVKPDYKAMAKQFFLENFQGLLTLAISGNPVRLVIIGLIVLGLILVGLGIF